MSDEKDYYERLIVDNGLLAGRDNFKITFPENSSGFPKIFGELSKLWELYRSTTIPYTDFIIELIEKQNCQMSKLESPVYLLYHNDKPSAPKAVLMIVEDNLKESDPELLSFLISSLSYIGIHQNLRYGVLAIFDKLILFDFDDQEFRSKNLIFNLSELFNEEKYNGYYSFEIIFSCLYSYDAGGREVKQRSSGKAIQKRSKEIITNRNLYKGVSKITSLNESLESEILRLSKDVSLIENKMYTSYEYQGSKICEVHLQKTQIKIWVPMSIEEIINPRLPVKDVRKIGHYGTGATEFFLKNDTELDDVMDIIRQSFHYLYQNEGK